MKEASPALVEHLANVRLVRCADLIAITLQGGATYRYTDRDAILNADGYNWQGGTPLMSRTGTRRTIGIEVGTMDLTIHYRTTDLIGPVPWSSAVRLGLLDGAEVVVRRGYWDDWSQPAIGSLHVFEGRVSDIEGGAPEIKVTLRSATELFDTKIPRSLYQAGCRNTLYDPLSCKVTRADIACSAIAGATRVRLSTSLTQPDGWFTGGVIRGVAGVNAGVVRGVKQHLQAGGVLVVAEPWPVAPAAGDTFLVAAGCDHTRTTCATKFFNAANFRGEPYTPSPETTL